ncbi:ABC transporter A family member 2-like [Solanum pennellii]|uniref:ABC transporter A family member 2-like n=1 Tax=Solanum pennellii TaxID=28526 RepID=A0ABM1GYR6_SOLPN|nr:ABC transporter A family member 2-like [Solanum pennellii]
MELQGGIPLLMQQYKALFKKNLLLALRNKPATFLQLFSSFFFIFLLFCIKLSDESRNADNTFAKELRDPKPLIAPPIPPCEDKFYIKTPCYDFIWSGKHSKTIGDVVKGIMANNPGRPIPADKVLAFNTAQDVDKWLFDNPVRCPAAVHFTIVKGNKISYGIQTNSTDVVKRGVTEDPTFKFQIPLQMAAEREIARNLIGDPNFPWDVSFKEFPHPPGDVYNEVTLSAMVFFMAVAIFGFVFQVSALITEKELKLRQAMTMMGLFDTAYWLSWITWEGLLIFISSILTVIFGMMFQFDFFLRNNVLVVFLLFFLFQLTMVTFGYWLSTFLTKAASATNVAFVIFIVGFITMIGSQLANYPYSAAYSNKHRIYWSLFPPNLLTIGLQLLTKATESPKDPGISWSTRAKCLPKEPDCVTTMHDVYILLVKTFFFWLVLAIYFDNIIPNISGVRKSKLYFLYPGYWTGNGGSSVKEGGNCSICSGSLPRLDPITPDDEDVLTEENTVKKQAMEGENSNNAVQIRGLIKTYPGKKTGGCCCCCCRKTSPPFHSVKGLWLNVEKDQLLCMLGPNGAGKTTTISCLTGINPVTAGDALVYDQSIRSSMGMTNIRRMMGVCPQFDILWDSLSGQENLQIFANIKGLPPASIDTVVAQLLSQSKITKVSAKMRSCSYSGGMKRRLSVAIALIGDPKLVILDEPTTGMDPITRRHVWDIIEKAKKGRAIILTTHSMEEADVLSDRIGIMAKGRLRCIGTSIRLKAKFGTGFIANVGLVSESTSPDAVKHFFKSQLDVVPKDENKCFLTYVIPHEREKMLTEFFAELQARQSEFGVKDIQLGLTTLEEVFMNIAKQADVETAIAEGRFKTLTLNSGDSVEVPVGAQFIGIPGTKSPQNPGGVMVEVYWEPDETGSPCIYGISEEMPIPPHIQLRDPPTNNSPTNQGIVIDPSQLKMHLS